MIPSAKSVSRIPNLFDEYKPDGRPWLIAGMGPTFDHYTEVDFSQYNVLGINRVVSHIPVDLCSIIDFYIVEKVRDAILKQAKYLVIPKYPHFGCRPHFGAPLHGVLPVFPTVRQMHDEDRLLTYDLSTSPWRETGKPVVKARFFSAEAAFSMLALLGVKVIRTLGIDGGTTRSNLFSDHGPTDPRGFDIQWEGINKTISTFGIDYEPLYPATT